MLIEFRVKNFKSFREEQVLSLLATRDGSLAETNTVASGLPTGEQLLRSVAIYGANASGKSNLLDSIRQFQGMVRESAKSLQEGEKLPLAPFAFDPEFSAEPIELELTFALEGVRYQYGFATTPARVMEEWLLVYRSSKPQAWFRRRYDSGSETDHYQFSDHLKGPRKLWQDSTRGNALFLSIAVQFNSESLRPIFRWITQSLRFEDFDPTQIPLDSLAACEDPESKKELVKFISDADAGIMSVEVQRQFLIGAGSKSENFGPRLRILFEHEAILANGHSFRGKLSQKEESVGTMQTFRLAGPILKTLAEGAVLIIDELGSSLHPLLVEAIVRRFHRSEGRGAQLIFSTHDTSLLATRLFRRDQIFFIEKDRRLASQIVPLNDFSPRKGEALEKGYLEGRYGGVPIL